MNIVNFSYLEEKDKHRLKWVKCCVRDIEQDVLVPDTLLHLKEIISPYGNDKNEFAGEAGRSDRVAALSQLDTVFELRSKIVASLVRYMQRARPVFAAGGDVDPASVQVEPGHTHLESLSSRLNFLRFFIVATWLQVDYEHAHEIWLNLIDDAACPTDRDLAFNWFTLNGPTNDCVTPDAIEQLYTERVLKLPPATLTDGGYRCFESFFKSVNIALGTLERTWSGDVGVVDKALNGVDELYRFALECPQDAVGVNAIAMIKQLFTNMAPSMPTDRVLNDNRLIEEVMGRIADAAPSIAADPASALCVERSLTLLKEFTVETDAL